MMHVKRIRRVLNDLGKLQDEIGRKQDAPAHMDFARAKKNVQDAFSYLEQYNIQWLSDDDWN